MPEEIAAGLYRIRLPLPWAVDLMPFSTTSINVYLVHSGSRLMLVDCGLNSRECWENLRQEFARLGLRFSQLTDLVVTHTHPDHVGLLDALQEEAPAATVYLHSADLALARERFFQPDQVLAEYRDWLGQNGLPPEVPVDYSAIDLGAGRFTAGQVSEVTCEPIRRTFDLGPQRWEIINTPGHTPGHIALYNPVGKILLAGDHFFANSSPNISRFPGSSPNPLGDYLTSLNRIGQLSIDLALPGHGEFITDTASRIKRITEQYRRKLNRLLTLFDRTLQTPFEIVNRHWTGAGLGIDDNSSRLLLTETLALISWLTAESYLDCETDHSGNIRYRLTPVNEKNERTANLFNF